MGAPTIPIHNLYYLLIYAWDALEEKDVVDVGELGSHPQAMELLASVLANSVGRVLRRGLDRGYVEEDLVLPGIRGKLDVAGSLKQALFPQGRTRCIVDELSHDVPHNRIVRSTLALLARSPSIKSDLRGRLADLYRRFEGVSEVVVTPATFRRVQLHRNNRHYGLLLHVCRLICDSVLVDERSGRPMFRDFSRDEHRMRRLFERFVRTFYKRHARGFRVRSVWLPWQEVEGEPGDRAFLPGLETDIVLQSPERVLVVDTKFKARTLAERHGKQRIHTENLYQIYAYMRNLALFGGFAGQVDGLLLYRQVDEKVMVDLRIHGHRLLVRTVDLAQPWEAIHRELLDLLAA